MSTMTTGKATAYDYNNQQQERQRMTKGHYDSRQLLQHDDCNDTTITAM